MSAVNGRPFGDVTILQQLKGHTSDVTCCDFAPNFTLITGSRYKTTKHPQTTKKNASIFNCFSDKSVRIWEWSSGGNGYRECEQSPLIAHKYGVTCVRVSPQGAMLVTASVDGTAILWALKPLERLRTFVQVNGDSIRMCR